MKKVLAILGGVALLGFAAVASAEFSSAASPPPNHHVHDCTLPPTSCVYPHLAVGFFPTILGESTAAYLQDPAECNDATDKALLPPNDSTATPTENQALRAGVCYTSTTVIHMRSIDVGDPPPAGWSGPVAPVSLGNGVTYVTYWRLTPR